MTSSRCVRPLGPRPKSCPAWASTVSVLPRLIDGQPTEVLWSALSFTSGTLKPTSSGIPILFPFAGRLRGDVLHYQGRDYPQTPSDIYGNAIHGFVVRLPWRIIEQTGSKAVGQFQASCDEPSLLERWPADFLITVSYELRGALRS